MSERIIIEVDGISMKEALLYAYSVVRQGRISGDGTCCCYVTTFTDEDGLQISVFAKRNEKSDKLMVIGG